MNLGLGLGVGLGSRVQRYADFVRSLGPVGWWRLGETSGTNAADLGTGTAANGTYVNTPLLNAPGAVANDADGCPKFVNGSGQYVDLGNPAKLSVSGNFTITAWVRLKSMGAFIQIFSKSTADGANENYELRTNSGGNGLEFLAQIGGASRLVSGASTLALGTWYHVAVVYNGSDVRIYRNGAADGSAVACSGSVTTNAVSACIGARKPSTADHFWDGWLDEAKILNYALPPELVLQDYNLSAKAQVTATVTAVANKARFVFSQATARFNGLGDFSAFKVNASGGGLVSPTAASSVSGTTVDFTYASSVVSTNAWQVNDEPPASAISFGPTFYLKAPMSGTAA